MRLSIKKVYIRDCPKDLYNKFRIHNMGAWGTITRPNLLQVLIGKRKHHKGWIIERYTDDN